MATKRTTSTQTGSLFPRTVPQMPEGYYSGDKPNPRLRAFVEAHLAAHPYDPATDDYDVPAFDKPIETTKATAIYNMHTYWSKKPHDAIRQYICHYTQPGDLVLDPFCGSGGTALAALMEGRAAIAIDRSPAATFITKNYCTPVDVDALREAFEELKAAVQTEIDWLYATRCDRCGGPATTGYTVYSQVFQCPRCLEKVPLFDCVEVDGQMKDGRVKKLNACPRCYARGITEEISTRAEKFGAVPVLVSYVCENGCKPARGERRHNDPDRKKQEYFETFDRDKLREIEAKPIPHWYPDIPMIKGRETVVKRNLAAQGVHIVADLFTKRNLWALAAYYGVAASSSNRDAGDAFRFGLDSICLAMSRMQGYTEDPRFPNQLMRGTYYLPQVGREYNVSEWLDGKLDNLTAGYSKIKTEIKTAELNISTQSCTDLAPILPNSVDYIFTDPPYSSNVQYGELNFVWEAWLGFDTHWQDEEIIVNEVRGKTEADWADMMRQAISECFRVLKPGRWLSLCYHDTSEGTWALIQDIMAEAGFLVDSTSSEALFIDTGQKSFNQLTADKVTKRDLVINFRKPNPGEVRAEVTISGNEDARTFGEKVRAIIRDYLTAHPGSTKDRVYDEVVSRMVRAGQMEAHDFDALLAQVAEEAHEPVRRNLFENEPPNLFGTHEIGRWYLKATYTDVVDAAEAAREDAAAAKLTAFIKDYRQKHPHEEGVHYSLLFERFLYAVARADKPRRHIADWLPDYFYKTEEGTWRLAASAEEERLKAEGRAQGTNRRIKRYLAYLQQGVAVPTKEQPSDATLAEWIRACKRAGLYEQGKQLYERGGLNLDALSEEAQVAVDEDYQVCVRMLERTRSSGGAAPKGRRNKSQAGLWDGE